MPYNKIVILGPRTVERDINYLEYDDDVLFIYNPSLDVLEKKLDGNISSGAQIIICGHGLYDNSNIPRHMIALNDYNLVKSATIINMIAKSNVPVNINIISCFSGGISKSDVHYLTPGSTVAVSSSVPHYITWSNIGYDIVKNIETDHDNYNPYVAYANRILSNTSGSKFFAIRDDHIDEYVLAVNYFSQNFYDKQYWNENLQSFKEMFHNDIGDNEIVMNDFNTLYNEILYFVGYYGSATLLKDMINANLFDDIDHDVLLFYTAYAGSFDSMRELVENNIGNVNVGLLGATILGTSSNEKVSYLLNLGADPNIQYDINSNTAFFDCCGNFFISAKTIDKMISCGAKINDLNHIGETAIFNAAKTGNVPVMKLLIDRGAEYDFENIDGIYPIHTAVFSGSTGAVRILVEHGSDINCYEKNLRSPLLCSTILNHDKISKLLITHGADVTLYDCNMMTPLHYAMLNNNIEIAEILLEHGSDINSANINGSTPLHLYVNYNDDIDIEVLQYFQDHGAQLEIYDNEGDTIMDLLDERSIDTSSLEIINDDEANSWWPLSLVEPMYS